MIIHRKSYTFFCDCDSNRYICTTPHHTTTMIGWLYLCVVQIYPFTLTVESMKKDVCSGALAMIRAIIFFVLLLSSIHTRLLAQVSNVSGRVMYASGESMPGVTVLIKGTTNGNTTNAEGKFTLTNAADGAILVFSFVGMKTQELVVAGQSSLTVVMEEEDNKLDEVVVVGYGTVKKRDLTGAVSSVKGSDISAFPNSSITQALQGRAAGVQVQQNSGAPGAAIQVRIRGANSIRGSNEPLYIIDGFPGDQNMLNSGDVESMEILKDASATAIYGSRGANGVVIVTTKRGKAGATRVDYEARYGIQTIRKKYDLMNGEEYMKFINIQQLNDEKKIYFTPEQINTIGNGVDWQDLLFRSTPIHDHSLNVSGGNEKTQFSVGAGFFDQAGVIINSNYRRLNLRANVNHDISKKFNLAFGAILSRTDSDRQDSGNGLRGTSLISAIVSATPTVTPYNADGSYRLLKTVYPFSSDGLNNPLAFVNEISNGWFMNRVMGNLAFTYKPVEGLSIQISGNAITNDQRTDNYTTLKYPASVGLASIATNNALTINSTNIINYTKTFHQDHTLSVVGGLTYDQFNTISLDASGSGFLSDATETDNIGAASTIGTPSSSYSRWSLLSYLGRANYSYKGKYLATVSFRADGSSRYSADNKWGYFPSGALAYHISEEDFMKNARFISDLKFRAGYGITGSTAIDPYFTLNLLSSGKASLNDAVFTYFAPGTRLPANLKWETTAQTDIGVDAAFFNDRLQLSVDYYIKNTRDLLNNVQLPSSIGYTTTVQNVGQVQNKGLELQIGTTLFSGSFKWNVSGNVAFNSSKVIKLYNSQDILGSTLDITIIRDNLNLLREGQPMSIFYGYQESGYDNKGKVTYKDNDGIPGITAADKTYIGNPNPNFIYGLNSAISWRKFDLNAFVQGVQGNDIYALSLAAQTLDMGFGLNMYREVLYNHWTPENPQAKYPYISKTTTTLMSDRFVFDGSYMRLKNVQLAYNVPVERLGLRWLKRGQLYVSGQNLLTLTSYPWQDPDVNSYGGSTSVTQGVDHLTYPTTKSYTFGIKISL